MAAKTQAADPLQQQIRFCSRADGVRIAYATMGAGPPLVKAANWLSHLEFDLHSPVWRHWLIELSSHRTLLRYDERGCGLSDWHVPELSFEAWVRDLEAIVEANRLQRFPLLGISQGASIAVQYAVSHPEKVSHLILYGGFLRGRLRRNPSEQQRRETQMMIELAELGWGQENPAFRQFFTTQFIPGGTTEQHRWFNELERVSTSPQNAVQFMQVMSEIDVSHLASAVACPTLVLHSTRDARVPFDEGRLMAGLIPGARFVPLESPNHLLLGDEPAWHRWVEEVRAFLPAEGSAHGVFSALTPRELELVELIAQGRDNAQIAASLSLSEKTVKNHITSIFAKLEVESRAQAIVLARESGFGHKNPTS